MGNTFSSTEPPTSTASHMQQIDHSEYPSPDFNVIFNKGLPKLLTTADDLNRMANYMMDMRNMAFGVMCLSIVGILIFIILKSRKHGKQSKIRREHVRDDDRRTATLEDFSIEHFVHEPIPEGNIRKFSKNMDVETGSISEA